MSPTDSSGPFTFMRCSTRSRFEGIPGMHAYGVVPRGGGPVEIRILPALAEIRKLGTGQAGRLRPVRRRSRFQILI